MHGLSRSLLSGLLFAAAATLAAAPGAVLAGPSSAAPPTVAIAFGAPTLGIGDSTTLTFTLANPNAVTALTGISISDSLPSGLMIATPNGRFGTCAGTITATAGALSLSLADLSLEAESACTFGLNVTGISPGLQVNTTSAINSAEGGVGSTASASITVGWSPTLGVVFNPWSIPVGGTSTLTFSLYNPETNSNDLSGLSFTAGLAPELTVADGTDACNFGPGSDPASTGSVAISGGHTITLSGATLPVGWVCSFSVVVTGPATNGEYWVKTSALSSNNGIPGAAAVAAIIVGNPNATAPATSITSDHGPAGSDPTLLGLLAVAFAAGFVAVRRAATRGHRHAQ